MDGIWIIPHPRDDLLDLFFVTLHLQHAADLREIDVLFVAQTDDLVKGAEELKRVLEDLPFAGGPAHIRHDTREQMEGLDVLEDV